MTLDEIEQYATTCGSPPPYNRETILALVACVRAGDAWLEAHELILSDLGTSGFSSLVECREGYRTARAKLETT